MKVQATICDICGGMITCNDLQPSDLKVGDRTFSIRLIELYQGLGKDDSADLCSDCKQEVLDVLKDRIGARG